MEFKPLRPAIAWSMVQLGPAALALAVAVALFHRSRVIRISNPGGKTGMRGDGLEESLKAAQRPLRTSICDLRCVVAGEVG